MDIEKILQYIVPGLVAVFGNVIFYLLIKSRVERKMIVYSGLHKEKIELYRESLGLLYDIKQSLKSYIAREVEVEDLFERFEVFLRFWAKNKPFFNTGITSKIDNLIDLQMNDLELVSIWRVIRNQKQEDTELIARFRKNFKEVQQRFGEKVYDNLIDEISDEIREDLNTIKLYRNPLWLFF